VEDKAQIDIFSMNGFGNALACAASLSRAEIIKFLIESGASAVPPPKIKEWGRLFFHDSVTAGSKGEIILMLTEAQMAAEM
jgi:hypothetical protein